MAVLNSKHSIQDFLQDLAYKDVTISVDGNKLRMHAPKGVLTPELRRMLLRRKDEILRFYKPLQEIESSSERKSWMGTNPTLPKYMMPLSYAQEEIWFQEMLRPETAVHHVAIGVELFGQFDEEQIKAAFQLVLNRHSILRTAIRLSEYKPQPVPQENVLLAWEGRDLSELSEYQRDGRRDRAIRSFLLKPFALDIPPLMRILFIRIEQDRIQILINAHRLIADEETLERVLDEAGTVYADLSINRLAQPDDNPPYEYVDFAAWQRRRYRKLSQNSVIPQIWRNKLKQSPRGLPLPIRRPESVHALKSSHRAERAYIGFAPSLIKGLITRYGTDPGGLDAVMLTAFGYVLAANTISSNITVGTYLSHRHSDALPNQDGLGNYTNLVPIFLAFDMARSVDETIAQVADHLFRAMTHVTIPFGTVIEPVMAESSLLINELVPIRYRLRNRKPFGSGLSQYVPRYLEQLHHNGMSNTEGIFLDLYLSGNELNGVIEFGRFKYEPKLIARLVDQFMFVLRQFVDHPHMQLGQVDLESEIDKVQQLRGWNQTEIPFPSEALVHELFEDQARRTPNKTALVTSSRAYTFRELNSIANQLARYLQEQGLRPLSKVALAIAPSFYLFAASLAVTKCSATLIPLSHISLEIQDYGDIVEGNQIDLLIIDDATDVELRHVSPIPCQIVNLDQLAPSTLEPYGDGNLHPMLRPNDPFAILLDQGPTWDSTIVTHQAVINHFNWMWRTFSLTSHDRAVYISRPGHTDVSWEMFGGLLRGMSVLVLNQEIQYDHLRFIRELAAAEITYLSLTPYDIPWLLEGIFEGNETLAEHLPAVKHWFVVGTPADSHMIQALREELADRKLRFLYKSPKLAGTMLWHEIEPGWVPHDETFNLGKPIDNTYVYVVGRQNLPQGVGQIGEVVISGVGVSPDWSKVREYIVDFSDVHPGFKSVPGQGGALGFRTGDMGRFLPNGEVEYIGRRKDLIKISGQRVNLRQMENRLRDMAGILDAVIVPHLEPGKKGILHAYISGKRDHTARSQTGNLTIQDVHEWLLPHFEGHVLPESIFFLNHIPKKVDGTVDFDILIEETAIIQLKDRPIIFPRNETESRIAEVWQDLLLVNEIGVQDHFFDLGGDFMLALEMGQRLSSRFRVPFRFGPIFRNLTIEKLAFVLNKRQTRTHIKLKSK